MLNRRDLFAASGAAAALSTALGRAASAKDVTDVLSDADTLRGAIGLFERLPELNAESVLDFHTGYRVWMMKSLSKAQVMQAVKVLRQNGIDPASDAPLDTVVDLLTADPVVALDLHNWERTQEIMWAKIKDVYDARADHFLAELADAERKGPGTLDLRPDLAIPDYTRYEIHIQPGGYVGDRFAGYIYYHGQNVVFPHGNYQDNLQVSWARAMPRPADGTVRRVLDQGCSAGQFTMVLKKLFPEAEVWGNDVAAPMLRYAHMRTVKHGLEIHYAQELSEKSHFPDNHFDLITNNLLVHEMPAAKVRELLAESYRTLRPGGVYYPLDSYTGDQQRHTALSKYYAWRNYRWNHEVWWMEYYDLDIAQAMRDAGFKVDENGPAGRTDTTRNVIGYKV